MHRVGSLIAWYNKWKFADPKPHTAQTGLSDPGAFLVPYFLDGEPGVVYSRAAQECTVVQIQEEVWTQLKQALNVSDAVTLDDANLLSWFLDPDIQFPNTGTAANAEPLLINTAGSLQYRPAPGGACVLKAAAVDRIRFGLRLPHHLTL
jgi:hypothetical protein